MTIDMPEEALSALGTDPEHLARELRLAAAVKWYESRRVSQERAAQIAGLSRAEFLAALGQFGVTPFQQTAEEALEEAGRDRRLGRPCLAGSFQACQEADPH